MDSLSEFSSISVHHEGGEQFGLRLIEPASFRALGQMTADAAVYNMRTLATAIRFLALNEKCKRLFVPVDMETLERYGTEYARMLMTIPDAYRSKMFLELDTQGRPITEGTTVFSRSIQDDCGMSLAVWTKSCALPYVGQVVQALTPAVFGIDRRCVKKASQGGARICVLDAMERGLEGGARVLADGVDTAEALNSMREIGVELFSGTAVSEVRKVEPGEYRSNVALMSSHERRAASAGTA
ncbi:hypothetical protein [Ottowia sp.]|uniref:hypothetical protein n=1 Tax=Ottowia sp. TaxID=1898956 RepID=UPI0025F470E8|nr:hypothetical protein [Ottowia sp.]MBK6616070.1 hypothetical protein [Ottowia sp.]